MSDGVERPWLKNYPQGVSRDFTPQPLSLPQLLAESVIRFSARPAIEYFGRTLTYADLGNEVANACAILRQAGVRPGDRVGILLPNCPQHPYFFFGTQFAGGAAVHLSPLDAMRESEHKLRDSGARVLVTLSTASFAEKALELLKRGAVETLIICDDPVSAEGEGALSEFPAGVVLATERGSEAPLDLIVPDRDPGELALLQYTGGTTGLPKGAMLSQGNITAGTLIACEWWAHVPGGGPDNIYLCYSPLFHALGLTGLLRRLREGALSIIRQRFDVADALDLIERRRISTFAGVPTMWLAISNHPGIETRDLSSLVYLGSGAAPLPLEISRRLET
ncbi:MAG: AMP-binding protein, partial [Mesorhizobium sp.]